MDFMKTERIYLNDSDDRVYIDTYVCGIPTKRDAILVIPGGAYREVCASREGEPVALAFVARGYNAFVLNYRVGKEGDVFPKQLTDAGRAMLYIRKHAEEFNVNPERVFAVGFSAGGHLCASISTMYNFPEAIEEFGEEVARIRPTGAILAYPVTSLLENTHLNSFKNLLGHPDGVFTDGERERYSIERNIGEHTAPLFIWHTAEDKAVPPEASLRLGYEMAKRNLPFMLSLYPYGPHGISLGTKESATTPEHIQPIAPEWVSQADAWMKTLGNY